MTKKLQNFDVRNEQVVLATMMKSKAVRRKLAVELTEFNFIGKRHKIIFRILKSMVDLEFNEDTFDALAEGQEYGGYEYLHDLIKYYDENSNIEIHVKKLIKDNVKHRIKKKFLPELEEMLENPSAELEEIQEILNKADVRIRNSFHDNLVENKDILKSRYKSELRARGEGLKEVVGLGFPEIDAELVEGAQPGKVIVICARPSMGKTTFASNLIDYWTGTLKKKVLACPLETGGLNLLDYLTIIRANRKGYGITLKQILADMKSIDIAKKHKLNKIIDETLDDGCLNVADSRDLTLGKLKVILQNGAFDIAVVDLFEKLADVTDETLPTKLEEAQRIAQETRTCIVIVSQLRRFGKNVAAPDRKPDLEQIKNSGKYEEIGDLIVGLYRGHYYDKDKEDIIEVMVLKQRNGLRSFQANYEFKGSIATIGKEYKELDDEGDW